MEGLPADNGLFMPDVIPQMSAGFFQDINTLDFKDISFRVASALLKDDIDSNALQELIQEVFSFEVPIVPVTDNTYCLELFHGPTLAFKDFGARFMAYLMAYMLKDTEFKPCILVATSGDTGSAVAQGFFEMPGIDVVILYPKGKVSDIQEQQLTTMGGNVTALEIDGNFDDCQRLVKRAFLDKELKSFRHLTSANSINIARLLPQSFYYFEAYARLKKLEQPLVCSVPSGNFGNLMGGLIAKKMGLPIHRFIASNNQNRVFFDYLMSGEFHPKPSIATISNAMDVGNPSNFDRIMSLFNRNLNEIAKHIHGFTFNDEQTREIISHIFEKKGYLMDPHGAVGYLGLQEYRKLDSEFTGVFLGTAHPVKFRDVVEPLVSVTIDIPDRLQMVLVKDKQAISLSSDFDDFKNYLKTY